MESVKINMINTTDEVLAKLMNSAAGHYDCRVDYEPETHNVTSNCDEAVKPAIVNQVASIFGVTPDS